MINKTNNITRTNSELIHKKECDGYLPMVKNWGLYFTANQRL